MSEEVNTVVNSADVRASLDNVPASTPATEETAGAEGYIPALRRNASVAVDSGSGVVDVTGVRPPALNIAYGVGKFAGGAFNPGEMILGNEHMVASKETPLTVIVLKYSQFVKQALTPEQWNMGLQPLVFPTKEAAQAAGLRTEWTQDGQKPEADFALDVMLLIEKPADLECGIFGLTLHGKQYALAMASYDKTAYKSVKDTFLQGIVFAMRGKKTWEGIWELKTQMRVAKKNPSNKSWVPVFALKRFLAESEIKEIETLFGSFLTVKLEASAAPQDIDPAKEV